MDVDINKPEAAMEVDSSVNAGSVSSSFSLPGLLMEIPGLMPGPSEGLILPGVEEVLCSDFVYGLCSKTDCNLKHPTPFWLLTAINKPSRTMSQVPLPPSAAEMAAAQAIMAAQAQQAQSESSKASTGASEKDKAEMLKRTIKVNNINSLITADQLKEFFGVWGTIVDFTITDSNDFAYIEYSKPEQATAALCAHHFILGGRSLNVEMAESLPPRSPVLRTWPHQLNVPLA